MVKKFVAVLLKKINRKEDAMVLNDKPEEVKKHLKELLNEQCEIFGRYEEHHIEDIQTAIASANPQDFIDHLEKNIGKYDEVNKHFQFLCNDRKIKGFIYASLAFFDVFQNKWITKYAPLIGQTNIIIDPISEILKAYGGIAKEQKFFTLTEIVFDRKKLLSNESKGNFRFELKNIDNKHFQINYSEFDFTTGNYSNPKICATLTALKDGKICVCVCDKGKDNELCSFWEGHNNFKGQLIKCIKNISPRIELAADIMSTLKNDNIPTKKLIKLFAFLFAFARAIGWKNFYGFTPNRQLPSGIIFLFLKKEELSGDYLQYFLIACRELFQPIATGALLAKTIRHSTKSAIATIMSRNGSHNIGSHVLAAVGTNSIDLPDDQILFKYIQHRMDYIAQITTEIPGWTYSSLFVQDIMRRFYMQRHLLNNIARSEGLDAYEYQGRPKDDKGKPSRNQWTGQLKDKLIIKVKKYSSDNYQISPCDNDNIEKELDVLSLAIPGGVIGQHAFFTILENIIRNSAKHEWSGDSSKRTQKNLEITIEYEDNLKNDFVVFRIWDNVSDVFATWKPENKGDKAKEALPDDSTKQCMDSTKLDVLPLHQRLNCYLSKSFVDQKTGKLLQENWGLAEMKISAGYLNKKSIEEIGENGSGVLFNQDGTECTGLIRAIGIKDESNDKSVYRLGFEFAVPKPKELLIIGEDIPEEPIKTEAKKSSVYFFKTDPVSLDYEFVVFQKDQCENLKKNFEYWHYPHRLFCVCKNNKQCDLKNRIVPIKETELQEKEFWEDGKWKGTIDWDKLKLFLYTKWIEYRYLKNGEEISMYMDTDPGSNKGRDPGKSALGIFLDYYKDEIYKKYFGGEKSDFKTKEDFEDYIKNALYGNYPITSFEKFCTELNNNDIAKKYEKYLTVISDMMIKYDEYIETLPGCYIAEDGNGSGKGLWKDSTLFNNNEKIKLITNENHAKIKYKRHAKARDANNETYYEALSGSQTYFSMLENPPTGYHKKKLALQLVENALAKILIIDERAANYYLNGDSKVKTRLDKAGICIVSKFNYNGKLHKVIKREIEKSDPFDGNHKYNYIIIHQGILDKFKPNKQCTEEEKNNYLVGFIDYLKKHCDLLAVTSGRGQPDQLKKDLEKNLKFLPFSNLESFVLKPYHEKFLLVQVLDQLIRERKVK